MSTQSFLVLILPVFWPKMVPVGLGYLQSYLQQYGLNCRILDLNNYFYNLADRQLKQEWLISCNLKLENEILSIIKKRYARQLNKVIEIILEHRIVGFSCFKSNFKTSLEIAAILKSRRKDIKIILGGPEISRQFFKYGSSLEKRIGNIADFLVAGEGEKALLNYLNGRESSKRIVVFDELSDLQGLGFPRYNGIDFNDYPRKDALPVQYSRGCVRKCAFCSERLLYKGYRQRAVSAVIEEIKYHKQKNRINYFVFFDSLINADLQSLDELCGRIIDDFGSVNWEAQIAVRPDMPDELFKKMKKSGCYNLFVGLESGSEQTLKRMNKGFTAVQARKFFKKMINAGLFFGVSIITGYPGESEEEFKENLDFIIRNKEIIPKIEQINPFTYYEGTAADNRADYKFNKRSLERMTILVEQIKGHNFKYTNAFLGNLVEK